MNLRDKLLLSIAVSVLVAGCSSETDGAAKNTVEVASETVENNQPTPTPTPTAVVAGTPEPAVEAKPAETVMSSEASESEQPTESENNASSQSHIIKGVITQWQPLVTFAQPGNTVKFTNMTGHDTASMEGMIPEGATPWQSKLGEEGFTVVVEKEGAYVYKCTPHITTGMVGIIVVGDKNPANLATLEEQAGSVKIGGNMVKRAIRKMKKQIGS